MDLHYRVKFVEGFKDGNILEKEVPANTIQVIRKDLYAKIINSGGMLEIIETLIPNPLKHQDELPAEVVHDINLPVVGQEPEEEGFVKKYERWAKEDGEEKNEKTVLVTPRKRGRPRKNPS